MTDSRRKGKDGELELCRLLSSEGFAARRGQQHRGGPDSPDVVCDSLPGIHFECKRTERLNLYDALDQARDDAGERIPVVAHRRSDCRWLAVLDLRDLLAILRESSLVASQAPAVVEPEPIARLRVARRMMRLTAVPAAAIETAIAAHEALLRALVAVCPEPERLRDVFARAIEDAVARAGHDPIAVDVLRSFVRDVWPDDREAAA